MSDKKVIPCPKAEILEVVSKRLEPFVQIGEKEELDSAGYDRLVDQFIAEGLTRDESECLLAIADRDIDEMFAEAAKNLIRFIAFRARGLELAEKVAKLRPQ
jgi:hypothetical protein